MASAFGRIGPVALASGTSTPTGATVTASHTWTLRSIRIVNTSTSLSKTVYLTIGAAGTGTQITPTITIPKGGVYQDNCFVVLASGEHIEAVTSATGLTFTASYLDQS